MFEIERNHAHDEMIDMAFEPYEIGQYKFYPSDVLFNCDPILYGESVKDYEDMVSEDGAQ